LVRRAWLGGSHWRLAFGWLSVFVGWVSLGFWPGGCLGVVRWTGVSGLWRAVAGSIPSGALLGWLSSPPVAAGRACWEGLAYAADRWRRGAAGGGRVWFAAVLVFACGMGWLGACWRAVAFLVAGLKCWLGGRLLAVGSCGGWRWGLPCCSLRVRGVPRG